MKSALAAFYRDLGACRACYGDKSAIRVASPPAVRKKGPPPRILLVGEQPPRDDDAEPATDQATIREFMEAAGIDAADTAYVTAVLCTPEDESLRPGRPTPPEARNCAAHLRKVIELIKPRIIVPLGHTSIYALQSVYGEWSDLRRYILNYDCGRVLEGKGVTVYPLYHPSPTTWSARPRSRQVRDWQRIPALLEAPARSRAAS
jgi:DNA polymerase